MQALDHQEIVPKDDRGGMVSRENYKSVILCIFYITLNCTTCQGHFDTEKKIS